ncbi:ATP-binding protein [Leptospira wolffii]|uniref:AlbA family DNA-binding domain-containing protein n=1 Tax=Leptospira wolffii TaxID=409998 RepID=UPI00108430E5|nr:ATP-binding protein [Leptospira wolffii]TGK59194.1 ATP-binding protein [Leptospira wolffii]TGK70357.1 ATP-binding protein [Leptospira wolffii]TGK71425.1 ATP-binding protein [Leptospira wolffii]TGL29298.1 ATP-binding protein [Leptospira wolffii]
MEILELFHSINKEVLDSYLKEGKEESLYLDFKRLKSLNFNSEDDKNNLAKALSGYANSSGGIIIWGIDTEKIDGIDRAKEYALIENVDLALARIEQLTGELVSPKIVGVLNRSIKIEDSKGVIATFIPESVSPPHMAISKLHQYYKRSGDSFYKMEHFDIADMFGRRRNPSLEFVYSIDNNGRSEDTIYAKIAVGLRNTGRGLARFPMLQIALNSPYSLSQWGIDGNGRRGLSERPTRNMPNREHIFVADSSIVIHPTSELWVTNLDSISVRKNSKFDSIKIQYNIFAEDMPSVNGSIIIPSDQIIDKLFST